MSNVLPDLEKVPGRKTLGEFKAFLLRGNVVDLAVAVAVGAAFTAVVTAFVAYLITPLIAIPGATNFDSLKFTINGSEFLYGKFLNVFISFLVTAAVVFFFVVKPVNHLMERRKTDTDNAEVNKDCPECLSRIPAAARRCAFCTAEQAATAG